MNFRGSGGFQRLGAFVECRPGGVDIIDDENATTFDRAGVPHMEGIFDVPKALLPVEARLWFGPNPPDEDIEMHRTTHPAPESFGKQARLVEASLLKSPQMEGDRKDHVGGRPRFAEAKVYKQIGKGGYPMELISELQLMYPPANHTGVMSSGARAVKKEQGLQAVAT